MLAVAPLPIVWVGQERHLWCWAACTAMVASYLHQQNIVQCRVVERYLKRQDCCACPGPSPCNKGCPEREIADVFVSWSVSSSTIGNSIAFETLQNEVRAHRPVQVGWDRGFNSQHAVLVVGTRLIGTQEVVHVHDPEVGSGEMPYSDLLAPNVNGRWFATWLNLALVP